MCGRKRRRHMKTLMKIRPSAIVYHCGHIREIYVRNSGQWYQIQLAAQQHECPDCFAARLPGHSAIIEYGGAS